MRRLSLGDVVKRVTTRDRTIPNLGDYVSGNYPG